MERRLERVDHHEQIPVAVVDVGRFAEIDLLLLVLLVESTIFATVVRVAIVHVGIASVIEGLERGADRAERLIEILDTRKASTQSL